MRTPIGKLCECGCGKPAPIAPFSNKKRGWVRGQPLRFVRGHNQVANRYRFTAEDHANGGKRGYRYSDEHRQRIREAKAARGFKGPTYGKKQSPETKAKRRVIAISDAHCLHFPNRTDEESANWKGGKEQYQKRRALKRDDYTCQVCGLRDEEIACVDHIKPKAIYPELREDLSNMQTLCPNCHARKTIREKKEIFRIKRERKSLCG